MRFRSAALGLLGWASLVHAVELPGKSVLDLGTAQVIARAAAREATRVAAPVVIAIVDDRGYLLALERLDGAQVASSEVAIAKARTAAISLPGATPLQGGLPLAVHDQVVGAIGVSGNTPQQDEDIAAVGVARLDALIAAKPAAAKYIDAADVDRAFARGAPLYEIPGYKVHASRRDAAGVGEVHVRDTDIIHVLEGAATFVTGGELVDPKTVAPGEIRGSRISGGEQRRIAKGDVIVVPAGTPHWFKAVEPPVRYFVVKPTDAEE
jgi:glc operon protein GlcG